MSKADVVAASSPKKTKTAEQQIPFGISRYALVVLYMLAIALTGMPPAATDPLIQLMEMNGAASGILDPVERLAKISSIAGFGVTCVVLVAIIVGPLLNIIGAKAGAIAGTIFHVLGYGFMFMTNNEACQWFAGFCFGLSFQLILNSHLSIGVLFPKNASFILAALSAGPDLSLFLPPLMQRHAESGTSVKNVVCLQVGIYAGFALIIDALFVPVRPFEVAKSSEAMNVESGEEEALFLKDEEAAADGEAVAKKAALPTTQQNPRWSLPIMKQILSSTFLLFLPFFLLSYARKKHFATFIRPTLEEMDPEPDTPSAIRLVNLYNLIVPYGFIPAMLWGMAVDKLGPNNIILASALISIAWPALLLKGSMSLQLVTVLLFIVWQCFIFGMAFAFLASAFGFATLPTLQGVASCIAGLFSLAMDVYWPTYITHTLGSFAAASSVIFGLSLVCAVLPLAIIWSS